MINTSNTSEKKLRRPQPMEVSVVQTTDDLSVKVEGSFRDIAAGLALAMSTSKAAEKCFIHAVAAHLRVSLDQPELAMQLVNLKTDKDD